MSSEQTNKKSTAPANRFDPLAGLSRDEFRERLKKQSKFLPNAQIVPGEGAIAQRIGELLIQAEVKRCARGNKLLIWPVRWVKVEGEWRATNQHLDLFRITKQTKTYKKDGEDDVVVDNPNFGRFYVATFVTTQVLDENEASGTKAMREMMDFTWFDRTDYAISGCLRAVAPRLNKFLTSSWGLDYLEKRRQKLVGTWPEGLTKQLYLRGLRDLEILKEWSDSPHKQLSSKSKRKDDGDEVDSQIYTDEDDGDEDAQEEDDGDDISV